MSTIKATRRAKWQYPPPPPTPRILHLPRRPRRRAPKNVASKPAATEARRDRKGKLEALFDQERVFARTGVPLVLLDYGGGEESERRRVRVEESSSESGSGGGSVAEEKWRFQAEMLRAECNLLRMEKEIAVKKLERSRVKMERTLRSAVQTLVSGRKKISEENNLSMGLEEEIQDLVEKLEKLQRSSEFKDFEVRNFSNFDKQASLLRRRLEKFGATSGEICLKEIREMAEASLSMETSCEVNECLVSSGKGNTLQVEILRRKMEALSKGILLDRMEEEYRSMLSTPHSSVASSASSSMRIEFPNSSSTSARQPEQKTKSPEDNLCSGRCKAIVRRIVEQVRVETEQWSQMQEMLGQVRKDMEELQASRDFWENRALNSDDQIQTLRSTVQEWRHKAMSSESKANELQLQMSEIRRALEWMRKEQNSVVSEPIIGQDAQNETEKRVLVCRLKENHCTDDNANKEVSRDRRRIPHTSSSGFVAQKRLPFRDIGNSSSLIRQNSKAVFPLHCPSTFNRE
ncbi:protein Daple-like isoform X1 [Juglans microcarpa x Juglans regia]|uniref:protein Daple-like isoform X1 n=1 Tax=Juglans microcarpa x Juglans regia TaxID=2249226 RepID=UPI001B7E9F90|nr:protein Daple-like isoform X1 [Juglans microcarpa x Juglans regia]